MKILFSLLAILIHLTAAAQQMTAGEWVEEAKTNIRLLPRYGLVEKTAGQKAADQAFIESVLPKHASARAASNELVSLGFRYLYRDIKTAMYRFNQAYLMDSTNTDIYWGYGGVYMTLGLMAEAREQYLAGLALDPNSTHLLTDYGTWFTAEYYAGQALDEKAAGKALDSAIHYLSRSYTLDPTDQNTLYKLSICYLNKADCKLARKYFDECTALGGAPVTEDYKRDLRDRCPRH